MARAGFCCVRHQCISWVNSQNRFAGNCQFKSKFNNFSGANESFLSLMVLVAIAQSSTQVDRHIVCHRPRLKN